MTIAPIVTMHKHTQFQTRSAFSIRNKKLLSANDSFCGSMFQSPVLMISLCIIDVIRLKLEMQLKCGLCHTCVVWLEMLLLLAKRKRDKQYGNIPVIDNWWFFIQQKRQQQPRSTGEERIKRKSNTFSASFHIIL